MEESKEVRELLDSKQYTRLRQMLAELNDADIAVLLEELEEQDVYKRQYHHLPVRKGCRGNRG